MAALRPSHRGTELLQVLCLLIAATIVTAAPFQGNQHSEMEPYYTDTSGGCYYNFQHYDEGDRILTNEPCLNCTCHNRMLMCYLRVCPFTKAIGQDCIVEKKMDQCCPVITCPEVPVQLLTSSTTESASESTEVGHLDNYGCSIDEIFYTDGAQVPSNPHKPCELCYCIRNRTTCVMQECTLHVEGCRPVFQEGVCCPVRYDCDYPEDNVVTTARTTPGLIFTTTPVPGASLDCTHNNQIYADGALITTDKPCEHCYCMKGDIVCAVQECGMPLEKVGKNCTALPPKEGQCCPETYECDEFDMTTTETFLETTPLPQHEPSKDTTVEATTTAAAAHVTLPAELSTESEIQPTELPPTFATTHEPALEGTMLPERKPDENEIPINGHSTAPPTVEKEEPVQITTESNAQSASSAPEDHQQPETEAPQNIHETTKDKTEQVPDSIKTDSSKVDDHSDETPHVTEPEAIDEGKTGERLPEVHSIHTTEFPEEQSTEYPHIPMKAVTDHVPKLDESPEFIDEHTPNALPPRYHDEEPTETPIEIIQSTSQPEVSAVEEHTTEHPKPEEVEKVVFEQVGKEHELPEITTVSGEILPITESKLPQTEKSATEVAEGAILESVTEITSDSGLQVTEDKPADGKVESEIEHKPEETSEHAPTTPLEETPKHSATPDIPTSETSESVTEGKPILEQEGVPEEERTKAPESTESSVTTVHGVSTEGHLVTKGPEEVTTAHTEMSEQHPVTKGHEPVTPTTERGTIQEHDIITEAHETKHEMPPAEDHKMDQIPEEQVTEKLSPSETEKPITELPKEVEVEATTRFAPDSESVTEHKPETPGSEKADEQTTHALPTDANVTEQSEDTKHEATQTPEEIVTEKKTHEIATELVPPELGTETEDKQEDEKTIEAVTEVQHLDQSGITTEHKTEQTTQTSDESKHVEPTMSSEEEKTPEHAVSEGESDHDVSKPNEETGSPAQDFTETYVTETTEKAHEKPTEIEKPTEGKPKAEEGTAVVSETVAPGQDDTHKTEEPSLSSEEPTKAGEEQTESAPKAEASTVIPTKSSEPTEKEVTDSPVESVHVKDSTEKPSDSTTKHYDELEHETVKTEEEPVEKSKETTTEHIPEEIITEKLPEGETETPEEGVSDVPSRFKPEENDENADTEAPNLATDKTVHATETPAQDSEVSGQQTEQPSSVTRMPEAPAHDIEGTQPPTHITEPVSETEEAVHATGSSAPATEPSTQHVEEPTHDVLTGQEIESPVTEEELKKVTTELAQEIEVPAQQTETPLIHPGITQPTPDDSKILLGHTEAPVQGTEKTESPVDTGIEPQHPAVSEEPEIAVTISTKQTEEGEVLVGQTEAPIHQTELPVQHTEEPVQQTETPFKQTESPVHDTEEPSLPTEPSVQEAEVPSHITDIPVPETEKPVEDTEMPVHEVEAPINVISTPAHDTELNVHEAEEPSHDTEKPMLETEPVVQETETPVQITEAESPVQVTETSSDETESTVHVTEPSSHESISPVHVTEPSSHESELPVQVTEVSSHETESTLHVTEAPSHETESPSYETESPSHETESPVHVTDAPSHEIESPVHVTEETVQETETPTKKIEAEAPIQPTEATIHETKSPVQITESPVQPETPSESTETGAQPEEPSKSAEMPEQPEEASKATEPVEPTVSSVFETNKPQIPEEGVHTTEPAKADGQPTAPSSEDEQKTVSECGGVPCDVKTGEPETQCVEGLCHAEKIPTAEQQPACSGIDCEPGKQNEIQPEEHVTVGVELAPETPIKETTKVETVSDVRTEPSVVEETKKPEDEHVTENAATSPATKDQTESVEPTPEGEKVLETVPEVTDQTPSTEVVKQEQETEAPIASDSTGEQSDDEDNEVPKDDEYDQTTPFVEQTTKQVVSGPSTEGYKPTKSEEMPADIEKPAHVTEQVPVQETEVPSFAEHDVHVPQGVPGEGSCLVEGQTYENNSNVPSLNPCQISCTCLSSIVQCESMTCSPPPANMQNCMPIYHSPHSCCPTYTCTGAKPTTEIESDSMVSEMHPTYPTTTQPEDLPTTSLPKAEHPPSVDQMTTDNASEEQSQPEQPEHVVTETDTPVTEKPLFPETESHLTEKSTELPEMHVTERHGAHDEHVTVPTKTQTSHEDGEKHIDITEAPVAAQDETGTQKPEEETTSSTTKDEPSTEHVKVEEITEKSGEKMPEGQVTDEAHVPVEDSEVSATEKLPVSPVESETPSELPAETEQPKNVEPTTEPTSEHVKPSEDNTESPVQHVPEATENVSEAQTEQTVDEITEEPAKHVPVSVESTTEEKKTAEEITQRPEEHTVRVDEQMTEEPEKYVPGPIEDITEKPIDHLVPNEESTKNPLDSVESTEEPVKHTVPVDITEKPEEEEITETEKQIPEVSDHITGVPADNKPDTHLDVTEAPMPHDTQETEKPVEAVIAEQTPETPEQTMPAEGGTDGLPGLVSGDHVTELPTILDVSDETFKKSDKPSHTTEPIESEQMTEKPVMPVLVSESTEKSAEPEIEQGTTEKSADHDVTEKPTEPILVEKITEKPFEATTVAETGEMPVEPVDSDKKSEMPAEQITEIPVVPAVSEEMTERPIESVPSEQMTQKPMEPVVEQEMTETPVPSEELTETPVVSEEITIKSVEPVPSEHMTEKPEEIPHAPVDEITEKSDENTQTPVHRMTEKPVESEETEKSTEQVSTEHIPEKPIEPLVSEQITNKPIESDVPEQLTEKPIEPVVSEPVTDAPIESEPGQTETEKPVKPIVSEEVTEEQGVSEQVTEEPVISEQSETEGPVEPVVSEQMTEQPIESSVPELSTEKPVEPVVSEQMTEKPVVSEQMTEEPVVSEQITEEPVVSEQMTEEPVVSEQMTEEPVVSEQMTEEPIVPSAPEHITEKPVEPVVSEEMTEHPVEPSVPEVITEKPVISEQMTEQPDEPSVPEVITEKPVEQVISEEMTEQPDQPSVPELITEKPVEAVVSEQVTVQPVEPSLPEVITEKPIHTDVVEEMTEEPVKHVPVDHVPVSVSESTVTTAEPEEEVTIYIGGQPDMVTEHWLSETPLELSTTVAPKSPDTDDRTNTPKPEEPFEHVTEIVNVQTSSDVEGGQSTETPELGITEKSEGEFPPRLGESEQEPEQPSLVTDQAETTEKQATTVQSIEKEVTTAHVPVSEATTVASVDDESKKTVTGQTEAPEVHVPVVTETVEHVPESDEHSTKPYVEEETEKSVTTEPKLPEVQKTEQPELSHGPSETPVTEHQEPEDHKVSEQETPVTEQPIDVHPPVQPVEAETEEQEHVTEDVQIEEKFGEHEKDETETEKTVTAVEVEEVHTTAKTIGSSETPDLTTPGIHISPAVITTESHHDVKEPSATDSPIIYTTHSPIYTTLHDLTKLTESFTMKPTIPSTQAPISEEHMPEVPDYGMSTDDYEEEQNAFGPGTCRYGGKVYVSAQQIPRDDPCDFCFCFRSDIICLQQSCPPPIRGCHEEPIHGFCCPRYECPVPMATMLNVTTTTTTTTTTLPPHFLSHAYKGHAQRRGCQIQGQTYQVGELVRSASGPCMQCRCGGDGQMKCDPKVCSPQPMLQQMIASAASRRRR